MSFNKIDEKIEDFALFGDLLEKVNQEYNLSDNPSKQKVIELLEAMLKIVKDENNG